jgi:hypothetical protein
VSRLHESLPRENTRHATRRLLSFKRLRDEARIMREDKRPIPAGAFLRDIDGNGLIESWEVRTCANELIGLANQMEGANG